MGTQLWASFVELLQGAVGVELSSDLITSRLVATGCIESRNCRHLLLKKIDQTAARRFEFDSS